MIWVIAAVLLLLVVKVVWVLCAVHGVGDFQGEKKDILARCDYLSGQVLTTPDSLLQRMPSSIGEQFQGEWALYSCSMLAEALTCSAHLYPETHRLALQRIEKLIHLVLAPELRRYDALRWGEDPLDSLDGPQSHVSYLSHLAWMIGNYKQLGGDQQFDSIYHLVCQAMNRRMLLSPTLNLPTYPGEDIYVPDVLVAVVALHDYARLTGDEPCATTVHQWLRKAKTQWIDASTGLLASILPLNDVDSLGNYAVKGSYSALNCYYLAHVDTAFAHEQYLKLKQHLVQGGLIAGIKEYHDHSCWWGMDIDAGPIIANLSPSGTAFAIGPATYFGDTAFRKRLLTTAEIAGHTVTCGGHHYLLANIAPVGEAITLAMRTFTAK